MTNKQRRNSFKAFNSLDDLFGHYYFDKIVFVPETLDEKIFKYLTNHKDNSFNVMSNDNVKILNTLAKALFNKENINLLLFTKNKSIKILSLKNEDLEPNLLKLRDVDEPISKLMIHRINKNLIGEKTIVSFTSKEIDSFNNSSFYILEIKNKINKQNSAHNTPSINAEYLQNSVSPGKDVSNPNIALNHFRNSDNMILQHLNIHNVNSNNNNNSNNPSTNVENNFNSIYYLIRLSNENVERFEIACDTLKLYIPETDRNLTGLKKKTT